MLIRASTSTAFGWLKCSPMRLNFNPALKKGGKKRGVLPYRVQKQQQRERKQEAKARERETDFSIGQILRQGKRNRGEALFSALGNETQVRQVTRLSDEAMIDSSSTNNAMSPASSAKFGYGGGAASMAPFGLSPTASIGQHQLLGKRALKALQKTKHLLGKSPTTHASFDDDESAAAGKKKDAPFQDKAFGEKQITNQGVVQSLLRKKHQEMLKRKNAILKEKEAARLKHGGADKWKKKYKKSKAEEEQILEEDQEIRELLKTSSAFHNARSRLQNLERLGNRVFLTEGQQRGAQLQRKRQSQLQRQKARKQHRIQKTYAAARTSSKSGGTPLVHPCLLQDPSGACPDPETCPYTQFPSDMCLKELKGGSCLEHSKGVCRWKHQRDLQRKGRGSSSNGSGGAQGNVAVDHDDVHSIDKEQPVRRAPLQHVKKVHAMLSLVSYFQRSLELYGETGGVGRTDQNAKRRKVFAVRLEAILQLVQADAGEFRKMLAAHSTATPSASHNAPISGESGHEDALAPPSSSSGGKKAEISAELAEFNSMFEELESGGGGGGSGSEGRQGSGNSNNGGIENSHRPDIDSDAFYSSASGGGVEEDRIASTAAREGEEDFGECQEAEHPLEILEELLLQDFPHLFLMTKTTTASTTAVMNGKGRDEDEEEAHIVVLSPSLQRALVGEEEEEEGALGESAGHLQQQHRKPECVILDREIAAGASSHGRRDDELNDIISSSVAASSDILFSSLPEEDSELGFQYTKRTTATLLQVANEKLFGLYKVCITEALEKCFLAGNSNNNIHNVEEAQQEEHRLLESSDWQHHLLLLLNTSLHVAKHAPLPSSTSGEGSSSSLHFSFIRHQLIPAVLAAATTNAEPSSSLHRYGLKDAHIKVLETVAEEGEGKGDVVDQVLHFQAEWRILSMFVHQLTEATVKVGQQLLNLQTAEPSSSSACASTISSKIPLLQDPASFCTLIDAFGRYLDNMHREGVLAAQGRNTSFLKYFEELLGHITLSYSNDSTLRAMLSHSNYWATSIGRAGSGGGGSDGNELSGADPLRILQHNYALYFTFSNYFLNVLLCATGSLFPPPPAPTSLITDSSLGTTNGPSAPNASANDKNNKNNTMWSIVRTHTALLDRLNVLAKQCADAVQSARAREGILLEECIASKAKEIQNETQRKHFDEKSKHWKLPWQDVSGLERVLTPLTPVLSGDAVALVLKALRLTHNPKYFYRGLKIIHELLGTNGTLREMEKASLLSGGLTTKEVQKKVKLYYREKGTGKKKTRYVTQTFHTVVDPSDKYLVVAGKRGRGGPSTTTVTSYKHRYEHKVSIQLLYDVSSDCISELLAYFATAQSVMGEGGGKGKKRKGAAVAGPEDASSEAASLSPESKFLAKARRVWSVATTTHFHSFASVFGLQVPPPQAAGSAAYAALPVAAGAHPLPPLSPAFLSFGTREFAAAARGSSATSPVTEGGGSAVVAVSIESAVWSMQALCLNELQLLTCAAQCQFSRKLPNTLRLSHHPFSSEAVVVEKNGSKRRAVSSLLACAMGRLCDFHLKDGSDRYTSSRSSMSLAADLREFPSVDSAESLSASCSLVPEIHFSFNSVVLGVAEGILVQSSRKAKREEEASEAKATIEKALAMLSPPPPVGPEENSGASQHPRPISKEERRVVFNQAWYKLGKSVGMKWAATSGSSSAASPALGHLTATLASFRHEAKSIVRRRCFANVAVGALEKSEGCSLDSGSSAQSQERHRQLKELAILAEMDFVFECATKQVFSAAEKERDGE